MIVLFNDTIHQAIKYLEENHPAEGKVYLHIAEGFDCIESPDGQKGFGCYIPAEKCIYLAGDLPELEEDAKETELAIVETLAHEYKHFMQHCEGREFDEEEAENFATQVLAYFRKRGCDNGND